MNIFKKYGLSALACMALAGTAALSSCSNDLDEFSTDQYTGDFKVNVWGPCPVARGGELRFLGVGMDKVSAITLPGAGKVTDIRMVNNREIRITVPQEAEEGYLVVHGPTDIEAKTLLTFLEPISVETITPQVVKPGQVLTLKGEYLNLIHEVIFSANKVDDDAVVTEDEFLSHSRQEISFVVPAAAKTGGLILSDGDEEMPNRIILDQEITIVLPEVDKIITLSKAKPGDEVKVSGSNLDLVTSVVMANEETVEFTYSALDAPKGTITFTLPANACDGPVVFVTASGEEVVAVNIGECQPEDLVATPATELLPGMTVTITGKNLQMVATVSVTTASGLAETEFNLESNEKITFEFPAAAQSGAVVMGLKGGNEVSVVLSTAKPEVYTTEALPAGKAAVLKGKNLQVLASITFADGSNQDVTKAEADEARITIPVTAVSGPATLHMSNGETATWNANIDAPTGAYIISGGESVDANGMVTFKLGNPEKLANVVVNSQNAKYILDGDRLLLMLPAGYGMGTKIVLTSNDGTSLVYTYDFENPDAAPVAIWEGEWTNSGWGGNQDLAWGGYDWSTVKAGTVLTAHCIPLVADGEWWCISFRHGDGWGNLPGDVGAQIDTPEGGVASITLTQEIIDDLVANGGLVITGDGYTLVKVTLK